MYPNPLFLIQGSGTNLKHEHAREIATTFTLTVASALEANIRVTNHNGLGPFLVCHSCQQADQGVLWDAQTCTL